MAGESQVFVPALERLNTPGYLSRDLLSETPDLVSYTVYDEVTLFLHGAGKMNFKAALQWQQFLFRLAGLVGLFLLARSTGLGGLFALALAALVNLGATLPGPAVSLTSPEPTPAAFAMGLTLLGMGLFAWQKPLLSGFAAGLAICYDPVIGASFWLVLLAAFAFDVEMRRPVRAMLPILLIFLLLLGNLAQLQPSVTANGQSLFMKVSPRLAELQQFRTPSVWVSTWAGRELWHYLAIAVFGVWAAARVWRMLNRQLRWLTMGVGSLGLAAVLFSYLLLELGRYGMMAELQPARTLVFTVAAASLLCGLAGFRMVVLGRRWEALGWFALVLAIPADARILDLLRIFSLPQARILGFCVALAGALTWLLVRFRATAWRSAVLLAPVLAMLVLASWSHVGHVRGAGQVDELADWAERNTWGSSMFLFPDAGQNLDPGVFRAKSRRAVWADWQSGVAVDYSESAGVEWRSRWAETMQGQFSAARLQRLLSLPIDYYVLQRQDQIAGVRAVFTNDEFTVYDAEDLRNAPGLLRLSR